MHPRSKEFRIYYLCTHILISSLQSLNALLSTGLEFYSALRKCNDSYISGPINAALDTLLDSLRLFGPSRVFSSYNGGKDADVIMHLLRAANAKYSQDHGGLGWVGLVYHGIPIIHRKECLQYIS